jgi:hypothetical protein
MHNDFFGDFCDCILNFIWSMKRNSYRNSNFIKIEYIKKYKRVYNSHINQTKI